jgi:hypothetical protein
MAGLVPATQEHRSCRHGLCAWVAGTRPAMTGKSSGEIQ